MPSVTPATWFVMVQPWQQIAEPLVRRIVSLAELAPGQEVVSVGGGEGRLAAWLADKLGIRVEAVDPDRAAVARGESAATGLGAMVRPGFQVAPPTDLPHEAAVFDAAIVDLLTLGSSQPGAVLREAGRVLRPFGVGLVLAPVWHREPAPALAALLRDTLGLQAHLVVEWKRWMREAGLVELAVEGYPEDGWIAANRWAVALRGWRVAGLDGVRAALSPAARAFRDEVAARRLGLALIRGVRWPEQHQRTEP